MGCRVEPRALYANTVREAVLWDRTFFGTVGRSNPASEPGDRAPSQLPSGHPTAAENDHRLSDPANHVQNTLRSVNDYPRRAVSIDRGHTNGGEPTLDLRGGCQATEPDPSGPSTEEEEDPMTTPTRRTALAGLIAAFVSAQAGCSEREVVVG